MNWIAPYRDAIMGHSARLLQAGFSWLGEDDHRIQFTDGEVLVKFSVDRYEVALEVEIRHLGDKASNEFYRLDFVMRAMDGATTQDFVAQTPEEHSRVIGRFVDYILKNKKRLFGPNCPYAAQYEDFSRALMKNLMAQWAPKP
jgi:hypothetical protein